MAHIIYHLSELTPERNYTSRWSRLVEQISYGWLCNDFNLMSYDIWNLIYWTAFLYTEHLRIMRITKSHFFVLKAASVDVKAVGTYTIFTRICLIRILV
jgi:hypothetical protein